MGPENDPDRTVAMTSHEILVLGFHVGVFILHKATKEVRMGRLLGLDVFLRLPLGFIRGGFLRSGLLLCLLQGSFEACTQTDDLIAILGCERILYLFDELTRHNSMVQ